MKGNFRVATPPPKPLMVFDGNCNFCKHWIDRWRKLTGQAVGYLPFQDSQIAKRFPEIPRERFEESVQLIETDGAVYSGAEAVFLSLAKNPKWQWLLQWYRKSKIFSKVADVAYRFVAKHRAFFSRISGTHP